MNNILRKIPALKKMSALLLILVFALAITPQKTLHTWFANHIDSTTKNPAGKTPQLSRAGFNCQCNNLVAESSFIASGNFVVVNEPSLHSFAAFSIPPFVSLSIFCNNLRGPPLKV